MKKSDLKNGMYLATMNRKVFVKIDNNLVGIEGIKFIEEYDENLRVIGGNHLEMDIYEIYDGFCTFKEIACKKVQPTWKRKVEIDWNKVSKGTAVKVRDVYTDNFKNAIFLAYLGDRYEDKLFVALDVKHETTWRYKECKIDESIKPEWLIDEFEECDYENSFKTE